MDRLYIGKGREEHSPLNIEPITVWNPQRSRRLADKAKSPTTLGEDQHGVGRSHIKKSCVKKRPLVVDGGLPVSPVGQRGAKMTIE